MTYHEIISHYEACLDTHGDTHLGVDWPRKEDVLKRYNIMLDIVREKGQKVSLLDFGCGAAHLLEYICESDLRHIEYSGLDISNKFIKLCRDKHPEVNFYCYDILEDGAVFPEVDYIVMNGVFTEKRSMSYEEMLQYFTLMITVAFSRARKGLAFNVMSKYVDWERDDLFHLSFNEMAEVVTKKLGRHFVIRNDYGLYEYTVYVYKNPTFEGW